jgi:hypothetical protein
MAKSTEGSAPMRRFRATILTAGKTATGIRVPDALVEALGAGKRPAVRITLKGYTYRSTVAVMGGKFMIGVSPDVRAAAGVAAGDVVDVEMALDTDARTVEVPPELKKALTAHPKAKARFDSLSYSRRRMLVDPIARAKTSDTRTRNVAKAIAALS